MSDDSASYARRQTSDSIPVTSSSRDSVQAALSYELDPILEFDYDHVIDAKFTRKIAGYSRLVSDLTEDFIQDGLYDSWTKMWTNWPEKPSEEPVARFLIALFSKIQEWAHVKDIKLGDGLEGFFTGNKDVEFEPSSGKCRVDFILIRPNVAANMREARSRYRFDDILIFGELKESELTAQTVFIQAARYARGVFIRQPTRHFVLGFVQVGTTFRIFQCDRLGMLVSTPFDVNADYVVMLKMIVGFAMLNRGQLGYDTTIAPNNIVLVDSEEYALDKCLYRSHSIFSRGTTVWQATDSSNNVYIIKDSFQPYTRKSEGDLYMDVRKHGGQIPQMLEFVAQTTYKNGNNEIISVYTTARDGLSLDRAVQSFNIAHGSQRNSRRSLTEQSTLEYTASGATVEGSAAEVARVSAVSRSSSGARRRHLYEVDREFRRLVMKGSMIPLEKVQNPVQILIALQAALRAMKHLYAAGYLHRDISTGNIMLLPDLTNGILIDLDLAISLDDLAKREVVIPTGTSLFMAINIMLPGAVHTILFDHESLFWVLFWMLHNFDGPSRQPNLHAYSHWPKLSWPVLRLNKIGVMTSLAGITPVPDTLCPSSFCMPLKECTKQLSEIVLPMGKNFDSDDGLRFDKMEVLFISEIERLNSESPLQ